MIDDTSKSKPSPERFDEKAIPSRDDIHVHGAGLRCPFCHDDVQVESSTAWVACEKCLARHHESCWGEGGRCGGCGHDVALAGRLRPAPEARPRSHRVLWMLLAAAALAVLTLMAVGMVGYVRLRSLVELDAKENLRSWEMEEAQRVRAEEVRQRAAVEEEVRKRDEAQRMFVSQAEATRAAVELAEGKVGGPRHVEVIGGYAVVDAQGSWIFVETLRDGVRIVAAGLGTTFLEADGDAISFARPGGVPSSFGKTPGPPGTVMIADGAEGTRILDVTPEQRDAIVAALAAPPGEVDIAALLAEVGYVRKP